MTVSLLDIAVLESPQTLVIGESRAYSIDFSDAGIPEAVGTTLLYDDSSTDRSAYLTGSETLVGSVATTKKFTPPASSAGMYRLILPVTIAGQIKYGVVMVAVADKTYTKTAVGTSSYGTPGGVSMLVPRYANKSGAFDDTTRPTYNNIITLLDQVSSVLNAQLAQNGFTIPITDADVTPMLALFVNEEVASIVEGINGMGRFAPRTRSGGGSRFRLITEDVANFIEANSIGIAGLGAARPEVLASGIGYRDTDEQGDDTFPLFQRKGYGDNDFQKDWDTD